MVTHQMLIDTVHPIALQIIEKQGWRLSSSTAQLLLQTNSAPVHGLADDVVISKLKEDIENDPIFLSILLDIGNITVASLRSSLGGTTADIKLRLTSYTGEEFGGAPTYHIGAIVLALLPLFITNKYVRSLILPQGNANDKQ